VVLYKIHTGENLFLSDESGTLSELKPLCNWSAHSLSHKLRKISDRNLRNLLSDLLQKDEAKRPQAMADVLQHAFFNGKESCLESIKERVQDISKNQECIVQRQDSISRKQRDLQAAVTDVSRQNEGIRRGAEGILAQNDVILRQNSDIKHQACHLRQQNERIFECVRETRGMVQATLQQIRLSETVLRRAVFEATEVTCPTCFIILPNKVGTNDDADRVLEYAQGLAEIGEDLNACVLSEPVGQERGSSNSQQVAAHASGDSGGNHAEWGTQYLRRKFETWLAGKLFQESMWLYLVDEYTGLPVTCPGDATYPIEIKKPRECLRKYVPLMSLGIAAMCAHNGAASVAHLFGIPVPRLPPGLVSMAESIRTAVLIGNSAAHFDFLQRSLSEASCGPRVQESPAAGVGVCARKIVSTDGSRIGHSSSPRVGYSQARPSSEAQRDAAESCCGVVSARSSVKKLRGDALRQFDQFLKHEDPRSTYAGLRRVMSACGAIMWTACEDAMHKYHANAGNGFQNGGISNAQNGGISNEDGESGVQNGSRTEGDIVRCNSGEHQVRENIVNGGHVGVNSASAVGHGGVTAVRTTYVAGGSNTDNVGGMSCQPTGLSMKAKAENISSNDGHVAKSVPTLCSDDDDQQPVNKLTQAQMERQVQELSNQACAVSRHVCKTHRDVLMVKLELGMPVEFVVKKRVQCTPGIRATRKLTLEQRDGEPVLVNRCLYVRMYVCMCVCMYVRTHVCTYVCTYVCMYV
jgi:hypothetical protein